MVRFLRKLTEFVTPWFFSGLVLVLTGFAPDQWAARFLYWLNVPDAIRHVWPSGLDIRVVLVTMGVVVIVVGHVRSRVPRPACKESKAAFCLGHDLLIWSGMIGVSIKMPARRSGSTLIVLEAGIQKALLELGVSDPFPPPPPANAGDLTRVFLHYDVAVRAKLDVCSPRCVDFYEFSATAARLGMMVAVGAGEKECPAKSEFLRQIESLIQLGKTIRLSRGKIARLKEAYHLASGDLSFASAQSAMDRCHEVYREVREQN